MTSLNRGLTAFAEIIYYYSLQKYTCLRDQNAVLGKYLLILLLYLTSVSLLITDATVIFPTWGLNRPWSPFKVASDLLQISICLIGIQTPDWDSKFIAVTCFISHTSHTEQRTKYRQFIIVLPLLKYLYMNVFFYLFKNNYIRTFLISP